MHIFSMTSHGMFYLPNSLSDSLEAISSLRERADMIWLSVLRLFGPVTVLNISTNRQNKESTQQNALNAQRAGQQVRKTGDEEKHS